MAAIPICSSLGARWCATPCWSESSYWVVAARREGEELKMPDVACAGLLVEDTFCGPMVAMPSQGALHLLDDMPVRAGGCAANVAIDLAKQGVSVDLVGCVGEDSAAEVLFKTFA